MKRYMIYCLLMMTGLTCKKASKGDLGGQNEVVGKVFLVNAFEGNGQPQSGANINLLIRYLPASPDSTQFDTTYYLFSTPSGPDGIFTFTNLNPDSSYQIFAMTSIMDSSAQDILYSGHYTIIPQSTYVAKYDAQLELTVDQQAQNGLLITTADANGQTLSGCTVCIFTSEMVANALATDSLCQFSSYSGTSDSYGRVLKVDLLPNTTFYVNATIGADTPNTVLYLSDKAQPISVTPVGIVPLPMTLK
jgi:hypothetical protein